MTVHQAAKAAIRRLEMELRIIRAQRSYQGLAAGLQGFWGVSEAERQAQFINAVNEGSTEWR